MGFRGEDFGSRGSRQSVPSFFTGEWRTLGLGFRVPSSLLSLELGVIGLKDFGFRGAWINRAWALRSTKSKTPKPYRWGLTDWNRASRGMLQYTLHPGLALLLSGSCLLGASQAIQASSGKHCLGIQRALQYLD